VVDEEIQRRAPRRRGYELSFGPSFDWRATVRKCIKDRAFERELTSADADWIATRVGFQLEEKGGTTTAHFYHVGWPAENDHWRISCYGWAMYLRILRRYLEHGESVPYEARLNV
jgi:hypothetical protein